MRRSSDPVDGHGRSGGVVIIGGATHWLHLQEPAEVNAELIGSLGRSVGDRADEPELHDRLETS